MMLSQQQKLQKERQLVIQHNLEQIAFGWCLACIYHRLPSPSLNIILKEVAKILTSVRPLRIVLMT